MTAPAEIGVAVAQLTPQRGEAEENLERSIAAVNKAADAGNELIVLPELANSGYAFSTRAEAWLAAESIPDGPTCRAWRDVARDRGVWIVGGLAERSADGVYDSSVLIDREGSVLSVYRKLHLWSR